eukprot:TRINITY_DN367_c1_g1_i1.p1 TRINITY_DN367_c1_g1~~TRINITY_DN367_c1_g1_i1.p1  ORF type:complete len:1389 (+),score=388.18 TRINITY_DN367_c1_g1_i1:41-4168(+)
MEEWWETPFVTQPTNASIESRFQFPREEGIAHHPEAVSNPSRGGSILFPNDPNRMLIWRIEDDLLSLEEIIFDKSGTRNITLITCPSDVLSDVGHSFNDGVLNIFVCTFEGSILRLPLLFNDEAHVGRETRKTLFCSLDESGISVTKLVSAGGVSSAASDQQITCATFCVDDDKTSLLLLVGRADGAFACIDPWKPQLRWHNSSSSFLSSIIPGFLRGGEKKGRDGRSSIAPKAPILCVHYAGDGIVLTLDRAKRLQAWNRLNGNILFATELHTRFPIVHASLMLFPQSRDFCIFTSGSEGEARHFRIVGELKEGLRDEVHLLEISGKSVGTQNFISCGAWEGNIISLWRGKRNGSLALVHSIGTNNLRRIHLEFSGFIESQGIRWRSRLNEYVLHGGRVPLDFLRHIIPNGKSMSEDDLESMFERMIGDAIMEERILAEQGDPELARAIQGSDGELANEEIIKAERKILDSLDEVYSPIGVLDLPFNSVGLVQRNSASILRRASFFEQILGDGMEDAESSTPLASLRRGSDEETLFSLSDMIMRNVSSSAEAEFRNSLLDGRSIQSSAVMLLKTIIHGDHEFSQSSQLIRKVITMTSSSSSDWRSVVKRFQEKLFVSLLFDATSESQMVEERMEEVAEFGSLQINKKPCPSPWIAQVLAEVVMQKSTSSFRLLMQLYLTLRLMDMLGAVGDDEHLRSSILSSSEWIPLEEMLYSLSVLVWMGRKEVGKGFSTESDEDGDGIRLDVDENVEARDRNAILRPYSPNLYNLMFVACMTNMPAELADLVGLEEHGIVIDGTDTFASLHNAVDSASSNLLGKWILPPISHQNIHELERRLWFYEFLLGCDRLDILESVTRIFGASNWTSLEDVFMGFVHLREERIEDACRCFEEAWHGLPRCEIKEQLVPALRRCWLSVPIVSVRSHEEGASFCVGVASIFDSLRLFSQSVYFCQRAIDEIVDDLSAKCVLYDYVLKHYIDGGQWTRAYTLLCRSGRDPESRSAAGDVDGLWKQRLDFFLCRTFERGAVDELLSFPYVGCADVVHDILVSKAQVGDVIGSPNYAEVVYAFCIRRSDYKGAARMMFIASERVKNEYEVRDKDMTHRCAGYLLLAVNSLHLLQPRDQWLRIPSSRGDGSSVIVTLKEIERNFSLLQMVLDMWTDSDGSPEGLKVNGIVQNLLNAGHYDHALSLLLLHDIDLEQFFRHMTRRVLRIEDGSVADDQLWKMLKLENSLGLFHEDRDVIVTKMWDMIMQFQKRFDSHSTGWKYIDAIMDEALSWGGGIPLAVRNIALVSCPDVLLRTLMHHEKVADGIEVVNDLFKLYGESTENMRSLPFSMIKTLLKMTPSASEQDSTHIKEAAMRSYEECLDVLSRPSERPCE